MTFVHHSEFAALTTHRPDFRMKTDDSDSVAALTDNIETTPKEQVVITNPRWEHVDASKKEQSPSKAKFGDAIVLMADIQNYPSGAPVTFDLYDTTENPPLRVDTAKGNNEQGVGRGTWVVTDKSGKGSEQKLFFEAIARSKATDKKEISLEFVTMFGFSL